MRIIDRSFWLCWPFPILLAFSVGYFFWWFGAAALIVMIAKGIAFGTGLWVANRLSKFK
ncbi:MAG: hypothetical protein L0Y70_25050 [Gemmataceae bacterium]|nr:hypothetical protein [Gemmataceae bacterium]